MEQDGTVDEEDGDQLAHAIVRPLERAKKWCDLDARASAAPNSGTGFAFAYDQMTLAELEAVAGGNPLHTDDH